MEQQVLQYLHETTVPNTATVRKAEESLAALYPIPEFPFALLSIARHAEIEISTRKTALTTLRNYVYATWSPSFEETYQGPNYLSEEGRARFRAEILAICTSSDTPNDASQSLAANVVSKIATADFPDQWPDLFPQIITTLNNSSSDAAAYGALRVLYELIDSALSENQFFSVAQDLVSALQHVAITANHDFNVQAMAVNVLRSCFETLEQVLETGHAADVRAFLDGAMKAWLPFFIHTLVQPLSEVAQSQLEANPSAAVLKWKGEIALKCQVVKTLDKIKRVHVNSISAHVLELFQIIWEDMSRLTVAYGHLFVTSDGDSKLTDNDGLPYTLDALMIEEIDFLCSTFKAKNVKAEFQKRMQEVPDAPHTVDWLQELIRLLVLFARIPQEEEGLWQFDANLYLSETTSVTANYTPRSACAELIVRGLMEWLKAVPIQALAYFSDRNFGSGSWKEREAVLYLLNQALKDLNESLSGIDPPLAQALLQHVSPSLQAENEFIRAGAHLCLGSLASLCTQPEWAESNGSCLASTVKAMNEDPSEIVNVCCISVIPSYLEALPFATKTQFQEPLLNAVSEYMSAHDIKDDLEDADDVKLALIMLVRDAAMLDTSKLAQNNALDLLFRLTQVVDNLQLSMPMVEAFENIVSTVVDQHGVDAYAHLCDKIVPNLVAAFHIAEMQDQPSLTSIAAEIISAVAEYGADPLPNGFVTAVLPPLRRLLMEATDVDLVRPATSAVAHALRKGTEQFLAWVDPDTGKSSIETVLIMINRLLNSPDVEEAAADHVGELAISLVDKCGAEQLGSYLPELLQAVAFRLATAERAAFVQSLLMVFAHLASKMPADVVLFLSQLEIAGQNGLNFVLQKWLENSVHFAGFDEVRQNVVALSKIYSLQDPRVKDIHVNGELIIENTSRIKTRSQARLNPDRYTRIPADLKILKLLVDELKNAVTSQFVDLGAARAAQQAAEDDLDSLGSDDAGGDWEDVDDGVLDLGSEQVRNHLMSLAGEGQSPTTSRARDDETADYLIQWFRGEAGQGDVFNQMFNQLTAEEQQHLKNLVI